MSRHFSPSELKAEPPSRGAGAHDNGIGTLPDGSLVITAEQLARFGNGSVSEGRKELRRMIAEAKDRSIFDLAPVQKPASVRVATMADEPELLALMLLDLEENAERVAAIDPDRVLVHIHACTRGTGQAIAAVIDAPDGALAAVVMLHPFQWWFSKQYYYLEVMNFVHPDHRKSRHAADLLQFQKWWVDEITRGFGYRVYLLCGVLTARRVWAKKMMYKRRFTEVGGAYLYPPPNRGR
jgi:hypothetical protein